MNNFNKILTLTVLGLVSYSALNAADVNNGNEQRDAAQNQSLFERSKAYAASWLPSFKGNDEAPSTLDSIKTRISNGYASFMGYTPTTKALIASGVVGAIVAAISAKKYLSQDKVGDLENANAQDKSEADFEIMLADLEGKTWAQVRRQLKESLAPEQLELEAGSAIQLFAIANSGAKSKQPFIFDKAVKVENINLKSLLQYNDKQANKAVKNLTILRNRFFDTLTFEQEIMVQVMVAKYNQEILKK